MLFQTFQFAIFFCVLWVALRLLPRRLEAGLLLAASFVFYTLWYPPYLILLLLALTVNYALLRAIARGPRPRLALTCSVVFTLGLLAYFKYAAFLVETAAPVLTAVLGGPPPIPEVFLPLGISFYSFQMIALAVDTYRGDIEPVERFSRYALFISFFPQLIAGPILRGRDLLPQLAAGRRPTAGRRRRGLWLLASGLAKKVLLADFLLAPFVDQVFEFPGTGNGPMHLVAAYSYAFQIYFDFSGYSDMARGLALLLGFELPLNFAEPYLSRNPAELWRRWHMTLSGWLRDYIYYPLGGNRAGTVRTALHVLVTMVLGGLWHGPAWHYVAWGTAHGVWLLAHRYLTSTDHRTDPPLRIADTGRVLLCFHAWVFTVILFRATSVEHAGAFLGALGGQSLLAPWPVFQLGVVALCVCLHLIERIVREGLPEYHAALERRPWGAPLEGLAFGALVGLCVMTSGAGAEFIYFQF